MDKLEMLLVGRPRLRFFDIARALGALLDWFKQENKVADSTRATPPRTSTSRTITHQTPKHHDGHGIAAKQQVNIAHTGIVGDKQAYEPSSYDVFISFKNLDDRGLRTRDHAIAENVTHALQSKGISVFFSAETLERLGTSVYKKAIDKALDEAKVLVAIGTTKANLESEWVRYEWDGFLEDIISEIKPTGHVFVVTENMSPKDLPRGLRRCQMFAFSESEIERLINFVQHAMA